MTRLILSIFVAAAASVASASATERTVTLAVDNMTCELCPPIVKKSLARVPGVTNAEVSAEQHIATVVFDDQKTTVAALISATANAGYPSRPVP
jgi:periplasmic mercuric ion binding protein